MQRYRLITIISFFMFHLQSFGIETTKISTQAQFDAAIERINKGEEMQLQLASNLFYLKDRVKARSPLSIVGDNATIVCCSVKYVPKEAVSVTDTHVVYRVKSNLSIFPLFFNDNGEIYQVSESVIDSIGVNIAEGEFIVPEQYSAGAQVQIPIPNNLIHLRNKVFSNSFGYFDCGWQVINFRLLRSDDRYFHCTTLNSCSTKNYQFDNKTYRKPIRFVIYNAELKKDAVYYDNSFLYVPKTIGGLNCINKDDVYKQTPTVTSQSDLILDGIQFMGFDGISVVSESKNKCIIRNCKFQDCLGPALVIRKRVDRDLEVAVINNCKFINCSFQNDHCIKIYGTCSGKTCVSLSDCTIARNRDGRILYKNSVGSVSVEGDVSISRNVMFNSPRGHLFLKQGKITVTDNVFYNSDVFNANYERNICSDWGMIYCNHLYKDTESALNDTTSKIVIERNLIYGAYSYGNQARGIYIDDGRGDVECRNNVILNTQSYSMDSRNVKLTDASSARNQFIGNIVTSRYQLASGPAVKGINRPVSRGNILLDSRENVTSGVNVLEEDSRLEIDSECSFQDGKVMVSRALYKTLRRSPAWRSINHHVGRK